ncbi:iron-sulfur cluster biosynthesis protein [Pullulanibacillus camelliae]|uniref:Iron-sulfur cluster biosynthesis protein n=1 Tax=Pullulanibacillus camelliae TaxID=1707096 RepID=A0A8J2VMG5_9BACL|nr:iron-sulfur cluster biosynthesis family protein [Pullulanibacillus camelliae]GGE32745.1 iron-sulfur cluster biosynthesis protein [Pullulanibacillus camelliae]
MQIRVSEEAMNWFKEEVGVEAGQSIQFYSQMYGTSPVQEKFSLAFTIDHEPDDVAVETVKEGITFYIKEKDVWFFDGHDLSIDYNQSNDEIEFNYIKP